MPLTVLTVAVMGLVACYCVGRALVPAWREHGHPAALDVGHAAMAAAMVAMLLGILGTPVVEVLAVSFAAAGLGWLVLGVRRRLRPGFGRLGAACLAMAVMLAPQAASAAPSAHAGMSHPAGMPDRSTGPSPLLGALVLAALVLVGVVLALGLVRLLRPRGRVHQRLGAACEVSMAATMAVMLASLA